MAIFALTIAAIYLFVLPENPTSEHVVVRVILKYAHSLCWMLIAVAAGLFGASASRRLIILSTYAALTSYTLFIAVYLGVK